MESSTGIAFKCLAKVHSSYEHLFHAATENFAKDYLMVFRSNSKEHPASTELNQVMENPRLERYIGVIYRPDTEKGSPAGNI